MSAVFTLLVIFVMYFLGFLTAAMLHSGKMQDAWQAGYREGKDTKMNGHPNYLDPHNINTRIDQYPGNDSNRAVKESLTPQTDEISAVHRCALCTKTMQDDTYICETCAHIDRSMAGRQMYEKL